MQITQSDIDAGIVANVAFASGEDFLGHAVHESDPHKLTLPRRPAISLGKFLAFSTSCSFDVTLSLELPIRTGFLFDKCPISLRSVGSVFVYLLPAFF